MTENRERETCHSLNNSSNHVLFFSNLHIVYIDSMYILIELSLSKRHLTKTSVWKDKLAEKTTSPTHRCASCSSRCRELRRKNLFDKNINNTNNDTNTFRMLYRAYNVICCCCCLLFIQVI